MRLFISALLAALFMVSCGKNNKLPQGSGLIEATEVTLSAETAGQLKAIHYDEGQDVAIGDTIALIDTTTIVLKLHQAQAAAEAAQTRIQVAQISIRQAANNLQLAQKEFERVSSLVKSGSATQQQFDQVKTALEQANLANEQAQASLSVARADFANAAAQIAILQKQFDDCFPLAPINGTIVEKYPEAGELITIGKPLVRIAKLDTVWVKIYLPPADLTKIKLGETAYVDPEDGHNAPLSGQISWISSTAEFTPKNVQTKEARAGLLYAVKITIPNPNQILKIGMPVAAVVK
jgi:HlyD family secretion protein